MKQVYCGTDAVWSEGYFVSTVGIDEAIIQACQVSINLDPDNPGVALNLPDGTEVSPSVLEVSNIGGGELGKWLLIGIAIGSFLIALGLAVLLKFLPLRARLILFLVVLIGSLIGGVFGK